MTRWVKLCGSIQPADEEAIDMLMSLDEGAVLEVKAVAGRRTDRQNRAIHAFCDHLGRALNEAGLYIHLFPWKEGAEVEWKGKKDTKPRLWIPLQEAITGKRHSSDLTPQEVDQVYQPLAKKISSMGVQCPPLGRE